jgi:hypothetical protein
MNNEWLQDVRHLWGNEGYSARISLLHTIVDIGSRLETGAQVVEVGSGLSTLLLNRLCRVRGANLVALEHVADWKRLIDRLLGDERIVLYAPLKSYGEFDWYELPSSFPSGPYSLVVVDAPPEQATPGGRFGFLPVLGPQMSADCITIVDDYRPEKPWIAKLREQCGAEFEVTGELVATMVWSRVAGAGEFRVEADEDSDPGASPQRYERR